MSKSAARVGDMTQHGGKIAGPGSPNVLIGGMPAARFGDPHICPAFNGPQPHGGGTIAKGSTTVLINNKAAARVGDLCACMGPPNKIVPPGCTSVLIGD